MQAELTAFTIDTFEAFEMVADRWNRLWDSSSAHQPMSRFEGVALWLKHFGGKDSFRAVLVEDANRQLVGGLVFLAKRTRGRQQLVLTNNCWCDSGDLLIDRSSDVSVVVPQIISEVKKTGAPLLSFESILVDAPRWQRFNSTIQGEGNHTKASRIERVGLIDVGNDWQNYFGCLSGNHRSAIKRSEKKLRSQGHVKLERIVNPSVHEMTDRMSTVMRIEHGGWKGRNGSSILSHSGMLEYFLEEADFVRQAGMLELWFLLFDGEPIAFEYCHNTNGVCFSHKIGYDERFKQFGPGRLLRKLQLNEFTSETGPERTKVLDTLGTLCPSKAKWSTREYRIGRLTAALGGWQSNLQVDASAKIRSIKSQLWQNRQAAEPLKLGGISFLNGGLDSTQSVADMGS